MNQKNGVIQLIDSLNVGGSEMMAVHIANGLSELGYNSHICATRNQGELVEKISKDTPYLFLGRDHTLSFKSLIKFRKYVRRHSIKVLHAHSSSVFFAVQVKLILWNVKIIWHDHYGFSEDLGKRPILPLKICSYFVDTVLAVNQNLKNWSDRYLKVKKSHYFPNYSELGETKRNTILHGLDGKRITMIGAFRPQKDHMNALKAFKSVLTLYPEWTLHLVGNETDSYTVQNVKSFITENSLDGKIFLYGVRNDIKNILKQTSIGLLSSKSEGLPLALLEYGLSETAAVTTNVGQCKDVLLDSDLIVDKENADQLSEAIIRLIKSDEYKMKAASDLHNHVVKNYSKGSYLDKLLKIYSDE